jgi:hypothetical protein
MPYIIDNDTGRILSEAVAKISSRAERSAAYEAAMSALLSSDAAPQPGGPWCDAPSDARVANMFAAKYGGLTFDEIQFA